MCSKWMAMASSKLCRETDSCLSVQVGFCFVAEFGELSGLHFSRYKCPPLMGHIGLTSLEGVMRRKSTPHLYDPTNHPSNHLDPLDNHLQGTDWLTASLAFLRLITGSSNTHNESMWLSGHFKLQTRPLRHAVMRLSEGDGAGGGKARQDTESREKYVESSSWVTLRRIAELPFSFEPEIYVMVSNLCST